MLTILHLAVNLGAVCLKRRKTFDKIGEEGEMTEMDLYIFVQRYVQ